MKINIPEVLIHLRGKAVEKERETAAGTFGVWNLGMKVAGSLLADGRRLNFAQKLGRIGQIPFVKRSGFIESLPFMLSGWTMTRDLAPLPQQSFREWWAEREQPAKNGPTQ